MSMLRVALMQIEPEGSTEANLRKGIEMCRIAMERGADIALFPEMWSNGYGIQARPYEEWKDDAIHSDGPFADAFRRLASELDMAIALTFLETGIDHPRNSLMLIDRHGAVRLHYSKVHTCDFSAERNLEPGDAFHVADIDTEEGSIRVGAMICYDREFPESARILMLKGAELILVPNACPMDINRLSQLRGRAYENMLAIATCNYPEAVSGCNGRSSVFDGIAYLPESSAPRDMCLLEASGKEGIYVADIDIGELRKYRKAEVHGNAYRHPEKYHALIERTVAEPFIRNDRRG